MRKPLIAANWKMNHTLSDAEKFAKEFIPAVKNTKNREILIAAPFTLLHFLKDKFAGTNILLAAQNFHPEDGGAFTGEVSLLQIKEFCNHVLVGHSERRNIFHENNETVNKKLQKALEHKLNVILCIGEQLELRESGKTNDFLSEQLEKSLAGITENQLEHISLAYEPVWAIGTGKTATPELAQETHAFIRSWVSENFSKSSAGKIRILYGGSVKPENTRSLLQQQDIDGVLVGGASLSADSFSKIVNY